MRWKSCWYTWTNKREFCSHGFFKIYGVLGNPCWSIAFPDDESILLVDDTSGFVYGLIKCFEMPSLGFHPIKYSDLWSTDPNRSDVVRKIWQMPRKGTKNVPSPHEIETPTEAFENQE